MHQYIYILLFLVFNNASNQTGSYYPCLHPDVFNPTDLNADDWMEASASLGTREIILTAHHEANK